MKSCLPYLQLAILLVISKHQPICGYRIAKTLQEAGLPVEEAAVYTILQRLHKRRLVEPIEVKVGGRIVKRYRLTREGEQELQKLLEMYAILTAALDKLIGLETECPRATIKASSGTKPIPKSAAI